MSMRRRRRSKFRVIDGCPCPKNIAPYFYIVLHDAGANADSIYRGSDAKSILHHHGHHDQEELYWLSINGTPAERAAAGLNPLGGGVNPPGRSTHEGRSDGVAYRGPIGRRLPWWCQGMDLSNPNMAHAVMHGARNHGWDMFQPYPSGSELHHLNFKMEPRPRTRKMALRIRFLRARLPRR